MIERNFGPILIVLMVSTIATSIVMRKSPSQTRRAILLGFAAGVCVAIAMVATRPWPVMGVSSAREFAVIAAIASTLGPWCVIYEGSQRRLAAARPPDDRLPGSRLTDIDWTEVPLFRSFAFAWALALIVPPIGILLLWRPDLYVRSRAKGTSPTKAYRVEGPMLRIIATIAPLYIAKIEISDIWQWLLG